MTVSGVGGCRQVSGNARIAFNRHCICNFPISPADASATLASVAFKAMVLAGASFLRDDWSGAATNEMQTFGILRNQGKSASERQ